jgi:hypothetical protein
LKSDYARALSEMGDGASLKAKEAAGGAARNLALRTAFEGVDIDELETALKSFIGKCRNPWPEDKDT